MNMGPDKLSLHRTAYNKFAAVRYSSIYIGLGRYGQQPIPVTSYQFIALNIYMFLAKYKKTFKRDTIRIRCDTHVHGLRF